MLIHVSTVTGLPWSCDLDISSETSVNQLKLLLTTKHGLVFQKTSKVLGKFAGGMMITLDESAKVCREILLRDIQLPSNYQPTHHPTNQPSAYPASTQAKSTAPSASPVQKFLHGAGESTELLASHRPAEPLKAPKGQGMAAMAGLGLGYVQPPKAKAAAPGVRTEQKRSWLRICQQVWKVPGTRTTNVAQMTEAGITLGQMMTALSHEAVQEQLDSWFQLLSGDHLQVGSGGEANIIECIMGVSRLVCRVAQKVLNKQHGEMSLRSFSAFFGALEEVSALEQVSKLLGSLQYVIWMGPEQRPSLPRKQPVKAIPSSIFFAYAHHAALPPLERRKKSTARTLAFLEVMLREYGQPGVASAAAPLKLWILGAEDGVEGELAVAGYFDEAAAFLGGEADALRMRVELHGGDVTRPVEPVGKRVTVQRRQESSAPDLVFCPRVTLESLAELLSSLEEPLLSSATLAVSCCSSEEADRVLQLLDRVRSAEGQVVFRKLRNLFSGMAAGKACSHDEHGWLSVVRGMSLEKLRQVQVEELVKDMEVPSEKPESAVKSSAVFWGILDLKYDPNLPMERRIKVLETGDGRSSKFSGYGAAIKENFKADKKLEETLHRSVLVENKKLTHEFFVESGYGHLMPRQMCFRRKYYDSMALDLIEGLQLKARGQPEKACVLKLCNRARGAGCIPIQAADLDVALERLLKLPEDVEGWLKAQDDDFPRNCKWGCFEEQVRHWWSNECPVFVAEELCHSAPVKQDGQNFDGTMRVGFSLQRIEEPTEATKDSEDEELLSGFEPTRASPADDDTPAVRWPGDARPGALTIQWLGGYWKLPAEDTDSSDLSAKIISKARQGTAPVDRRQLQEVYVALGDSVQLVFTNAGLSPQTLLRRYPQMNELGAFIAARLACSMRIRDPNKSNMVLGLAQAAASKCGVSASPCKEFVESYIHRNFGVIDAMMGKKKAVEHLRKAIAVMPSNATARYLLGMQHLESELWTAAISSFEESLQLDPDFKAPWVNMAVAFLRLRQWQRVIQASDAGLYRHPSTAHCFYNKGLALYFIALEEEQALLQGGRWHPASHRALALQAFQDARSNLERSSLWTEKDEQLVNSLQNVDSCLSKPLSWDGWKFFAWRP